MVEFKIKTQTLEDFLATDDLFVEYFNTFLSLPSFPEPLCFNEATGGFEVVNNAKKDLAKQIKAAVRSQQKKNKIYKVTKTHSFIDIPLIPIEESEGPEKMEIDTSFTVTTLNKEQGIHWIKAERLPAFLESDCYLEYRLARILSQAKLIADSGVFAIMKIDFRPRVKKSKEKPVEEETQVDTKAELMKNMFVSMGNTETTDSDIWFTQAQSAQDTTLTFTTLSRPLSSNQPSTTRPPSSRPKSCISGSDSYRTYDSGFGSPMKSSVFSSSYFGSYTPGVSGTEEMNEDNIPDKLYLDLKPTTPRPSDTCCILTGDQNVLKTSGGVTYSCPKTESTDSESGVGDTDHEETDFETESHQTNQDEEFQDDAVEEERECTPSQSKQSLVKQSSSQSIVLNNIDDLGSVIVGAVLKRSIAKITGRDESEIEQDEQISSLFIDPSLSYVTFDMLDHISLNETQQVTEDEQEVELEDKKADENDIESDADSLLDSEEDYEEGDDFFRKHKVKTYDLSNKKGLAQFKSFLKSTVGEKYFKFWIDIDRSHLFPKDKDVLSYIGGMRDKYHRTGAPYEISKEMKIEFGLVEPSQWTVKNLRNIQNKIAEPLVTYWAPRFLLKQLMKTNPEKYYLYHHQHLLRQRKVDINPNPPTKSLLPLRPKSCQPRIYTSPIIQDAVSASYAFQHNNETSPPVGMRRGYSHLPKTRPTTASAKLRQADVKKKPREFLEPRLHVNQHSAVKRCQSAFSRSSSNRVRSKNPLYARRGSAESCSSAESWDSASVNMIPNTPSPQHIIRPPTGSRPSSREVTRRASKVSIESQFIGGQRMEALLQALENEKSAGGFFKKFVERNGNELWRNCLLFWLDIQDYHDLFYQETVEPYNLQVKSQLIYSKYVVTSSLNDIECTQDVQDEVYYHLFPPFEELFDAVEEHALAHLYSAWLCNLKEDVRTYNKVELIEVKRHLETKSKYVLHLQKSGIIKERVLTPDDPMNGYEDPVYDPSLMQQIPDEFIDLSLEKLVHNRIELEHFRDFLAENYASMDLLCWMEVEAWRRVSHTDEKKRDQKAKEIKIKYLNKKYFFGPNSPAGKEGQEKVMNSGGGWGKLLEDRPPNAIILEAQKYVRERLEKKWFPLFLTSEDFAERQKIDESMADVVDDVIVQRRRRSQAVWKLLESRWTSSSKEIILLRKALLNPVTSIQFRRYVSIKGDNLENNVLFWQEVQKYKDMYHSHSDDGLILQKINAIINCFIDSQIPPSIQIDIPHDMADKIIDHKYERSPYLFREAQLAVFRVISSHWPSFCDFRANLADDKVLPTIERQRRHAKKKERAKQQELEDRLEKTRKEHSEAVVDPFKNPHDESVGDEGEFLEKDRVAWSYSNYMKALDEEDILNNTNESIFSSITDISALKEPTQTTHRPNSASFISEPVINSKATHFNDANATGKQHGSTQADKLTTGKKNRNNDSPVSGSVRLKSPPLKIERTVSSPSLQKTRKPSSPPTKSTSEAKHVKYTRGMPPLVKPREK